jgi:hypothetical protein
MTGRMTLSQFVTEDEALLPDDLARAGSVEREHVISPAQCGSADGEPGLLQRRVEAVVVDHGRPGSAVAVDEEQVARQDRAVVGDRDPYRNNRAFLPHQHLFRGAARKKAPKTRFL